MLRRAAGLLLLLGLSSFWQQPAAAGKLIALVIGNESPDNGLSKTDLTAKLGELKTSLFKYASETVIIDGMNLSREQLLDRIGRFEAGLEGAEVAFFYYAGLGAHNLDGSSYLIPHGWDGSQEGELVAIGSLLEKMRANANSKGLVFLDALKPKAATGWQPSVRPGLGSLSREADPDRLQIAFLEMASGAAGSGGLLNKALLRQLQPERIKLPQFASLVKEDVSFDTGSIHVPRLFGSVGGELELRRLSNEELAAKQQKCVASNKVALTEPMNLGATSRESSRSRFWQWFCPELSPPASVRRAPDESRPAQSRRTREAESPRRDRPALRSPGGGGAPSRGDGGGSSGSRAAASAVPTP